jgi:hypothetical protein
MLNSTSSVLTLTFIPFFGRTDIKKKPLAACILVGLFCFSTHIIHKCYVICLLHCNGPIWYICIIQCVKVTKDLPMIYFLYELLSIICICIFGSVYSGKFLFCRKNLTCSSLFQMKSRFVLKYFSFAYNLRCQLQLFFSSPFRSRLPISC